MDAAWETAWLEALAFLALPAALVVVALYHASLGSWRRRSVQRDIASRGGRLLSLDLDTTLWSQPWLATYVDLHGNKQHDDCTVDWTGHVVWPEGNPHGLGASHGVPFDRKTARQDLLVGGLAVAATAAGLLVLEVRDPKDWLGYLVPGAVVLSIIAYRLWRRHARYKEGSES